MAAVRAELMMANMSVAAGTTIKWSSSTDVNTTQKSNNKPASSTPNVTLSPTALKITELLKNTSTNSVESAANFDNFINGLHSEILAKGQNADYLQELPSNIDPARLKLSKQAANYLTSSLYQGEPIYRDTSTENPFSSIDRKSLSVIAFDSSGSFTSAERQVAFLEMTSRDIDFRNKTFDLQESLRSENDDISWGEITSYLRDAELSSAMSEAEKKWRGWPDESDLRAKAESLIKRSGAEKPNLPEYENLSSNSALVMLSDEAGNSQLANIPLKSINSTTLELIGSLHENPEYPSLEKDTAPDLQENIRIYRSIEMM